LAHPKENYAGYRIKNVWVFVGIDGDGDEGICAFQGANGWMPMVAADEQRLHQLMPVAQKIADARGCRIEVRHFGSMKTTLTIEPRKENDGGTDS
jgi:hypothetical protein